MAGVPRDAVKGDYDKVAALLRLRHPSLGGFFLDSPGGDVYEALKIGRLFRKYLIATRTPGFPTLGVLPLCRTQECTCASACALIWFGGVNRFGRVGLHRPRIDDPMFRGLAPAEASAMYRRALDMIVAYLNEMEVPKSIIEMMIATSSADIQWVDNIDDGPESPASIAEWVTASCGRHYPGQLTEEQFLVYDIKFRECQRDLFGGHRARLPPP